MRSNQSPARTYVDEARREPSDIFNVKVTRDVLALLRGEAQVLPELVQAPKHNAAKVLGGEDQHGPGTEDLEVV
jgi:hypothetical protein